MYDTLGQGAESGPWRNFYLTGALELRKGVAHTDIDTTNPEMAMALTVEMIIDSMAIRVNGPKAADSGFVMDWKVDDGEPVRLTLSNGALTHRTATTANAPHRGPADLTLTLTKPQLLGVVSGKGLDGVKVEGDPSVLATLTQLLDRADTDFAIVTP